MKFLDIPAGIAQNFNISELFYLDVYEVHEVVKKEETNVKMKDFK